MSASAPVRGPDTGLPGLWRPSSPADRHGASARTRNPTCLIARSSNLTDRGGEMRKRLLVIPLAAIFVIVPAGAASAHVHGITPLLQCSVVPANAGANQTDLTPASAANGGPITGLIPRDVGSAPLTV